MDGLDELLAALDEIPPAALRAVVVVGVAILIVVGVLWTALGD